MPVSARINHSSLCPNLTAVAIQRCNGHPRMFLVTLHDIPESIELLWNYNDNGLLCRQLDSETVTKHYELGERSLFMAGVGAEEKLFFLLKNTLPNHLLLVSFCYPTMFQVYIFSYQTIST